MNEKWGDLRRLCEQLFGRWLWDCYGSAGPLLVGTEWPFAVVPEWPDWIVRLNASIGLVVGASAAAVEVAPSPTG